MDNGVLHTGNRGTLLRREEELTRASDYEASVQRPAPHAPPAGRTTADGRVNGAGLAGLSAAVELRARRL